MSYSLASLTGLSRIHDNRHWASDVFCGAMLGWGTAKLLSKSDNIGIAVTPFIDKDANPYLCICIPFK